ncbi:MAG: TRAP transporter small permease [Notoacmeibacter sp.]|nr:TRAP transporter small permease [Notoacmeibacter sp.]
MARTLRRILDLLYLASGVAAAVCLVAILVIIVLQMAARWAGIAFPGSSEYAGYLMASASFLAFAYALNRGAHIRVNLFLTALGSHRFWGELWALVIGTAATSYLAWYAVKATYWSRKLHDVSQGQDATPIWIVQIPMAFGAILLALCFLDNLVTLIVAKQDNIRPDLIDQSHGE